MESMDEIYRAHAQTVYRYLLARTRDPDTAEELTQETFYQAVRSIGRYDGSCKITTWLCAIARNQLLAYRRKHPAHDALDDVDLPAPSAEETVLDGAARLALLRRVHALAEPAREVLYLRLFGGLSFREIGDVLGRTENWARVTYYRGKERLRKEMDADV